LSPADRPNRDPLRRAGRVHEQLLRGDRRE
jgi:hypothetical protein